MDDIKKYCHNDVRLTVELYRELTPQIDVRMEIGEQYGLDCRSKSDAQIAEVILAKKLKVKPEKPQNTPNGFMYEPPSYLEFKTPELQKLFKRVCALKFTLNDAGYLTLPDILSEPIMVGGRKYTFGLGGLHSNESGQTLISNDDAQLFDRDVVSYYPNILINGGKYPSHLGDDFLKVYSGIVDDRIKAKKAGDKITSTVLKIVVNGTFGKTSSKYSFLYAPDLTLYITITGQLSLLMLIEAVELADCGYVVSANTDGFVTMVSDYEVYNDVCSEWESNTGLQLEETAYKSIHSRDVNNYIAITTQGDFKTKGVFSNGSLDKNPKNEIVNKALLAYLNGKDPRSVIESSNNITDFLEVRTVNGGAKYNDEKLGRVVRWYASTSANDDGILSIKNNNRVPNSLGKVPLLNLTSSTPSDLNRDYYWDQFISATCDIGHMDFSDEINELFEVNYA